MDIQAAVGAWEKGARNERKDVETVQTVLAQAARLLGWADVDPKGVDGSIARPPRKSGTVAAIKAFQLRVGREATGGAGTCQRGLGASVAGGGECSADARGR